MCEKIIKHQKNGMFGTGTKGLINLFRGKKRVYFYIRGLLTNLHREKNITFYSYLYFIFILYTLFF